MYARIMHVTLKPEKIEQARALWGPAVTKFKKGGLHAGYMCLLDAEQGKVLSITIWESEEACRANEEGPDLEEAMAPFWEFFAADPWSEHGAVAVSVE